MKQIDVIHSSEKDHCIPDSLVEEWYEEVLERASYMTTVFVANSVQLDRLRVGHKNGDLKIKTIHFNDKEIGIKENGKLYNWPEGFFDQTIRLLSWLARG